MEGRVRLGNSRREMARNKREMVPRKQRSRRDIGGS
jgi:hypothetical protein